MSTTLSCPRCFTQRSSVRRMRTLSLGVDLATAGAAAGVRLALAGADSHRQDRQHRTELGNSWYRGAGPAGSSGGQGSIRRRMRCTHCRREVDPDIPGWSRSSTMSPLTTAARPTLCSPPGKSMAVWSRALAHGPTVAHAATKRLVHIAINERTRSRGRAASRRVHFWRWR